MRSTVPSNITAFKDDLQDRIVKYNSMESEADPAKQVNDITLKDEDKLNPIFDSFVKDGKKFL